MLVLTQLESKDRCTADKGREGSLGKAYFDNEDESSNEKCSSLVLEQTDAEPTLQKIPTLLLHNQFSP